MARDFILIDRTQTAAVRAQLLLNYRDSLRRSLDLGTEILGIMGHLNDGTNFTDIELRFGVPAGKGQIVLNMISGSVGAIAGTVLSADAKNITERLGGS